MLDTLATTGGTVVVGHFKMTSFMFPVDILRDDGDAYNSLPIAEVSELDSDKLSGWIHNDLDGISSFSAINVLPNDRTIEVHIGSLCAAADPAQKHACRIKVGNDICVVASSSSRRLAKCAAADLFLRMVKRELQWTTPAYFHPDELFVPHNLLNELREISCKEKVKLRYKLWRNNEKCTWIAIFRINNDIFVRAKHALRSVAFQRAATAAMNEIAGIKIKPVELLIGSDVNLSGRFWSTQSVFQPKKLNQTVIQKREAPMSNLRSSAKFHADAY